MCKGGGGGEGGMCVCVCSLCSLHVRGVCGVVCMYFEKASRRRTLVTREKGDDTQIIWSNIHHKIIEV